MIRFLLIFLLFLSSLLPLPSSNTLLIYAEDAQGEITEPPLNSSEDAKEETINKYGAVPPFPGGPVTSPMYDNVGRDHDHAGIDVGLDDVEFVAPFDGRVVHGSGNGFGDGWVYFYSTKEQNGYADLYLLFGDMDSRTAYLQDGEVKQGKTIGYVLGYNSNVSTGAHVHVQQYKYPPASEYAPFLGIEGCQNPVDTLLDLGVDLSGKLYNGPRAGQIGSENPDATFDIEVLKTLGDEINEIIKDWSGHAIKAVQNITPYAQYLIGLLCILDLVIPLILSGLSFSLTALVVKVLKYAGLYGLVFAWPAFINNILLSFITSISGALDPTLDVTTNVTQPQLLLQKAIYIISPVFQKLGTFTAMDYMRNIGSVLGLYIITFLIMGFYMATAIFIALVYLEFYISAGVSLVSVPFAAWTKSKFIPEGSVGHLVSTAIKLLFISILVGMSALVIKDVEPVDLFKMPTIQHTQTAKPSTPSKGDVDKKDDTPKVDPSTISNPYIGMIIDVANEYGIDPNIALAIAMRESGGDTLQGIKMPDNGDGIFQVTNNQEGYDPVTHQRFKIIDKFPEYKTNPRQNAEAGMCILLDKINMAGGDIWLGVKWYNSADPSQGDPDYDTKVAANYKYITGLDVSLLGHSGITTAMLITYLKIALGMISIAVLIMILPGRVMRVMAGPLELR